MFTRRFFIILGVCIIASLIGAWWSPLLWMVVCAVGVLALLYVIDALCTLIASRRIEVKRKLMQQMSLDQPNQVEVTVKWLMPKSVTRFFRIVSYDTVPTGFSRQGTYKMVGTGTFAYTVKPFGRGRQEFGVVRCFVRSLIGLCEASRFVRLPDVVKVYPTFRHLDKLEMMALNQNAHTGEKRVRRAGNNTNFEQIRPYVKGDDVRTINWRATARAAALMVNTYTDERSQPIIPIICSGPSMLIATEGITLLDRAASAAVALASSALRHYDEAGLITLSYEGVESFLSPERSQSTLPRILEYSYDFGLPPTPSERPYVQDNDVMADDISPDEYGRLINRQRSTEADADFDALAAYVLTHVRRKSLLVLFANFENLQVAQQVLPALQRIGRRHKLVVVMFENEGVGQVAKSPYMDEAKVSKKVSEMRFRTLCAEYIEQQQMLAAYLRQHHINVVFTTPQNLSAAVLREYLEIKKRAAL